MSTQVVYNYRVTDCVILNESMIYDKALFWLEPKTPLTERFTQESQPQQKCPQIHNYSEVRAGNK